MSEEQPLTADTLYLDAEHFMLATESGPPLEPRASVTPMGESFPGIMPREESSEEASA